MGMQITRKGRIWSLGAGRLWTFFAVLVVALMWSAVIGTHSVRASACTTGQCTSALDYADYVCSAGHLGVVRVVCPASSVAPDDFSFFCYDGYHEQDDCFSHLPS